MTTNANHQTVSRHDRICSCGSPMVCGPFEGHTTPVARCVHSGKSEPLCFWGYKSNPGTYETWQTRMAWLQELKGTLGEDYDLFLESEQRWRTEVRAAWLYLTHETWDTPVEESPPHWAGEGTGA